MKNKAATPKINPLHDFVELFAAICVNRTKERLQREKQELRAAENP